MPVKSIVIILLLLIIVWIPFILNIYNSVTAIALTAGFLIAGLIGDLIKKRSKPKQ